MSMLGQGSARWAELADPVMPLHLTATDLSHGLCRLNEISRQMHLQDNGCSRAGQERPISARRRYSACSRYCNRLAGCEQIGAFHYIFLSELL